MFHIHNQVTKSDLHIAFTFNTLSNNFALKVVGKIRKS
jgi:hypothetical protein